jgi:hypothetical protein
MFNKKDIEPEKQKLTASCAKCKHLVLKTDMKSVEVRGLSFSGMIYEDVLYCPEHKPNFDSVYNSFGNSSYYKNMIVDENGCPIGYIKVAPKKEINKKNGQS